MNSQEAITAEINEYLKSKLNVAVNLHILDFGSYSSQVSLLMASDDPVDLMISAGPLTGALYSQGALLPLDSALEKYGEGIKDVLGPVFTANKYDNQIYAVTTYKAMARQAGFVYNQDINEQYSLGLENAQNLDDIEAAFAKLKEADPSIAGLYGNNTLPVFALWDWDDIGNIFGVLLEGGADLTVTNLFESDQYKSLVERAYSWAQEGYIYSGAATGNVPMASLAGQVLGTISGIDPTIDMKAGALYGVPIKHVALTDAFIGTSSVQQSVWVVPQNAQDADRSVQLLNLMFTDSKLFNLLTYGIEGLNYEIVDAEKGIIDYPDGMTAQTKTWDNTLDWAWGNNSIGHIWNGNPETIIDDTISFNNNAIPSMAMGFTFDPQNVENEITACSAVATRYRVGLECGAMDPATALPEFIQKLKEAGIDTIIAEKQAQLDAWAEENQIS